MEAAKSLFSFILAGFLEMGGGYLMWLWLHEGSSICSAFLGGLILVLYGIVPA